MTAFHFLNFVETETARSERVAELFKDFQDNLFTGIAEIQEEDTVLYAFYARGKISTLYHLNSIAERIEASQWLDHLDVGIKEIKMRSLSLRIADLRLFKILIEEYGNKPIPYQVSLKDLLGKLSNSSNPSISFGESPDISFICYASGKHNTTSRLMTLNSDSVRSGTLIDLLDLLPDFMNRVFVCPVRLDTPTPAWVEQQLHEVFVRATQKLLLVYGSMRERVYLNKIIRSINFKAGANDWMIFVNARNLDDQEIFDSPVKAGRVYSEIMDLVIEPFISDLGQKLFDQTLAEITDHSSELQQKLLESMIIGKNESSPEI